MSRNNNHDRTRVPTAEWNDDGAVSLESRPRGRHHHHDPAGPGESEDFRGPRSRGRRGSRSGGGPGGSRDRSMGRAARGQLRAAVLLLLAERPRHGYDLIAELTDRSEGAWNPSPGAIYPMLRRLAAKGLVVADETEDGRRSFALTDEGRAFVEDHRAEWGQPWQDTGSDRRHHGKRLTVAGRSLAMAVTQVAQVGTEDQINRAEEILERTRKEIYGLLAE